MGRLMQPDARLRSVGNRRPGCVERTSGLIRIRCGCGLKSHMTAAGGILSLNLWHPRRAGHADLLRYGGWSGRKCRRICSLLAKCHRRAGGTKQQDERRFVDHDLIRVVGVRVCAVASGKQTVPDIVQSTLTLVLIRPIGRSGQSFVLVVSRHPE